MNLLDNKAYILTFHWATNYGAVMQCYALQEFLKNKGLCTNIINYVPEGYNKNIFSLVRSKNYLSLKSNLNEFKKEKKIEEFRKKYLRRTKKFKNYNELKEYQWENCFYFVGSDQIWNPYFTMNGEKRPTASYYLGFLLKSAIKISYAASFGVTNLSNNMSDFIKPYLDEFDLITVREQSGKNIINSLGLESKLVCDPVFLHNKGFYLNLIQNKYDTNQKNYILPYILHGDIETSNQIIEYLKNTKKYEIYVNKTPDKIEEWLGSINNAGIVITNSFHAIAFSIIFNVPFIAILIHGSGMNDRLISLLTILGLENRIVTAFSKNEIFKIESASIDWKSINIRLNNFVEQSKNVIDNILSRGNKNDLL